MGSDEISEDVDPGPGLGQGLSEAPTQAKEDQTRQVLAYGIVGVLFLFYLLMLLGVIFWKLDVDDMVRIAGASSGIQTLAAAVAGFYFARAKHH